jgi:hypothetical protein
MFAVMDFSANLSHWKLWIGAGSVVAVALGVAKAFEWFDGLISDKSRVALWYYLADVPSDEQIESWGSVFPKLIDRVFGPKALSWKFFLRSCIASALAVLLVLVLLTRVDKQYVQILDPFPLLLLLLYSMVFNAFPDYMSLVLNRYFVKLMEYETTARRLVSKAQLKLIVGILGLDTLLTALLAILSFSLGYGFFATLQQMVFNEDIPFWPTYSGEVRRLLYHPADLMRALFGLDRGWEIVSIAGRIFFFSGFFTSIWIWLYVLSIFSIKIAHKIRPVWLKLLPYLDIEKKPMQAIGRIAGVLAGASWGAILVLEWLGFIRFGTPRT